MKIVSIRIELSSKERQDGRRTLYVRLTKNKVMRRLNTGLFVRKKDFDKDAQHGAWIKKSDPQYKGKNQILKDIIYKLESVPYYFEANNIAPTLNAIMKYMQDDSEKETDFFRYSERVLQQIKDTGSVTTYLKIKSSLKKFRDYVKTKDLDFRDISVEFLNDYEAYLQNTLKNKVNTRHKDLKTIRQVFGRALAENQISQQYYPFFKKKLKTEKTSKVKLNENEFFRIVDLDLAITTSIGRSQRYFIFSYFACGMRFADVCNLRKKEISKEYMLSYKMGKTGETATFRLPLPAINILNEFGFKDKKPNEFVFPLIDKEYDDPFELRKRISSSNALVNKDLKKIATKADIEKRFGFHTARHTFASIALDKGVGIYEVSNLMRHSSIKITENYIKSLNGDQMANAIDRIYG
jgi:integrase